METSKHGKDRSSDRVMAKFVTQVVATVCVGFLVQYFMPWWMLAVGAFVVAYVVHNKPFISFLAGFTGGAALWAAVAGYGVAATGGIISQKIDHILPMPALFLALLVGGLVGGMAALSGALLSKQIATDHRRNSRL